MNYPNIIPRDQHLVSRNDISDHALKVLYRLKKGGYEAYLVGGAVRDLLLEKIPKDFDIATNATPEQVKKLFRNCRIIGRRFRLAHVFFGRNIIEVATFRSAQDNKVADTKTTNDGMLIRDNCYGSIEDDAWRRDFSINALYYNIADFSIVDLTGGMKDIEQHSIRLLGDTEQRFREDPVRIIRAIRFSAKLAFALEPSIVEGIRQHRGLLKAVPAARMYEECLKLFMSGTAVEVFTQLKSYQLMGTLFPAAKDIFSQNINESPALQLIMNAMRNTDQRINEGKTVSPGFLFATMLWGPVQQLAIENEKLGDSPAVAMQRACSVVLAEQIQMITLPKRFSMMAKDIWHLQYRFGKRNGKAPARFLEHPKFRAAYDFMLLREEVGEVESEVAEWWTKRQSSQGQEQKTGAKHKASKPRRRRNKSKSGESAGHSTD